MQKNMAACKKTEEEKGLSFSLSINDPTIVVEVGIDGKFTTHNSIKQGSITDRFGKIVFNANDNIRESDSLDEEDNHQGRLARLGLGHSLLLTVFDGSSQVTLTYDREARIINEKDNTEYLALLSRWGGSQLVLAATRSYPGMREERIQQKR